MGAEGGEVGRPSSCPPWSSEPQDFRTPGLRGHPLDCVGNGRWPLPPKPRSPPTARGPRAQSVTWNPVTSAGERQRRMLAEHTDGWEVPLARTPATARAALLTAGWHPQTHGAPGAPPSSEVPLEPHLVVPAKRMHQDLCNADERPSDVLRISSRTCHAGHLLKRTGIMSVRRRQRRNLRLRARVARRCLTYQHLAHAALARRCAEPFPGEDRSPQNNAGCRRQTPAADRNGPSGDVAPHVQCVGLALLLHGEGRDIDADSRLLPDTNQRAHDRRKENIPQRQFWGLRPDDNVSMSAPSPWMSPASGAIAHTSARGGI